MGPRVFSNCTEINELFQNVSICIVLAEKDVNIWVGLQNNVRNHPELRPFSIALK